MTRILVTLATLLVLVLGAAFAVPAFVDWKNYRKEIEDIASNTLGRKVQINGAIDLKLLPEPRLILENIKIIEGDSTKSAAFEAQNSEIQISTHGLFQGKIEAETIKLTKPVVTADFARIPQRPADRSAAQFWDVGFQVRNIEIIDGTVILLSAGDANKTLTTESINGVLSSPSDEGPYRFAGKFTTGQQRLSYDIQATISIHQNHAFKLSGKINRVGGRFPAQFDGVLHTHDRLPFFQGTVGATLAPANKTETASLTDIQIRSGFRSDFNKADFSDLTITIDNGTRPQVLTGAATLDHNAHSAYITLATSIFDGDLLLATQSEKGSAVQETQGWSVISKAFDDTLWLYPEMALRVSLTADRLQLRGDVLNAVTLDGQRNGDRWFFERARAVLPGEAALTLVGNVSQSQTGPRLNGVVSLEGQNLGRLVRWIDAAPSDLARTRKGTFSIKGAVAISSEATAFEGVSGALNGSPFKGSLNFEKGPHRKLSLTLSGESLDISDLDLSLPRVNPSISQNESVPAERDVAKALPVLERYFGTLDAAELDLAVQEVKSGTYTAQNLSARLAINPRAVTISKLNIETKEGLAVRGEGTVPLTGSNQGTMSARIEASTTAALQQALALSGVDETRFSESQIESLVPLSLSANYRAQPSPSEVALQTKGTLGDTKVEGSALLKGSVDQWKNGLLAAQIEGSTVNSEKLLTQFFITSPRTISTAGPATFSIRLKGPVQNLETTIGFNAPSTTLTATGIFDAKSVLFSFKGTGSATSTTPEIFLPQPLLALLGGEPKNDFKVEAAFDISPSRFAAERVKTKSPKNAVTGHIELNLTEKRPHLEAELTSEHFSPSAFTPYFTNMSPEGFLRAAVTNAGLAEASDFWSNQPFSISAFSDATANLSLKTKAFRLSNDITVSDTEAELVLQNGRLDLEKFEGIVFGGEISGSGTLGVEDNLIGATLKLTAANLDLSSFPNAPKVPIMRGKAAFSVLASGQGLTPRGLISVLEGRGYIGLSNGKLLRLSPSSVQKAADDISTASTPLLEDAISRKILDAALSGDFDFRRFRFPFVIKDGDLEIRRASFRSQREGMVRLAANLDIASMQATSSWQIGQPSDKRTKWPPIKLNVSGPLRDLGSLPIKLSAEDLTRTLLVRRMERDITRLEGLNKTVPQPPSWSTSTQTETVKTERRGSTTAPRSEVDETKPPARINTQPQPVRPGFEARIRDALQGQDPASLSPRYGR